MNNTNSNESSPINRQALAEAANKSREALGIAAGRTIFVHKKDAPGGIQLDAYTGNITTPPADRPDWCEGLVTALLTERYTFYNSRLGPEYAKQHALPDAIAFEDLGWIVINSESTDIDGEDGLIELQADAEFRMSVIAAVTGIDRAGELEDIKGESEVLMERTPVYTEEEAHALDTMQKRDLPAASTGTEGLDGTERYTHI